MNVTLDRAEFADAVAICARHLAKTASTPVLSGIHLEVAGDALTLRATDWDVFASATVTAIGIDDEGDGGTVAPGRFLAEIAKALDAPTVTLSLDGARLVVASGSARFSMGTMAAEDFPAMPELPPAAGSLSAPALVVAVAQVAVGAAREDAMIAVRPAMSAVLMEPGDTLTLVASDTFRLPVREVAWTAAPDGDTEPVLWPATTLADAMKLMGSGMVTLHSGVGAHGSPVVALSAPDRELHARVVSGEFPSWRRFIPADTPYEVEVERDALMGAVRRASLAATGKGVEPVVLTVAAGMIAISCGRQEHASDEVTTPYAGPDFEVLFNPANLREALGCFVSDRVVFGFQADRDVPHTRKIVALTGKADDGYRHLLMPLRPTS